MSIPESIDQLLSEARNLDDDARKVQSNEQGTSDDELIKSLAARYHDWYARSLALLPEEQHEEFRSLFEGNWHRSAIRKFLSDPLGESVLYKQAENKALLSPWQYPYERTFHEPFLDQQRILREHQAKASKDAGPPGLNLSAVKGRIFIGHGHNEIVRRRVKDFVSDRCGLEPVVIEDLASEGLTIIEKVERWGSTCEFAVLILSVDDFPDEGRGRARQNVIYELGWFHGKLGRSRTAILLQQGVEIFTDISGVIYLKFEDNNVEMVFERLRQEFEAADVI